MKTKIWLNNKILPWEKANIHLTTHSLHYGTAVFEGIRFFNTKQGTAIFRLEDHINRLFLSAKSLNHKIKYSKKQIEQAIIKLIKTNKLNQGYIRPIIFYGDESLGVCPSTNKTNIAILTLSKYNLYKNKFLSIKTVSFIRPHPKSTLNQTKISGAYHNSALASLEAKKHGYDEALLLDYKGNLAECTAENIFIVKNNTIYTPKTHSILPGITRDTIIKLSNDINIKIKQADITPKQAKQANEIFLTGTAAGILPVNKLDNKEFKNHKITKKIKNKFSEILENPKAHSAYIKYFKYIK